jgi:LysR family cyn operon transcriptional activator
MDLRELRAFMTIADLGSFARAADRLNVSQPALSRQIRALEERLGVLLFDRIGRRVQLTAEGEDLLLRTRNLLADAAALHERAHALKGSKAGILRVGATTQVIENLLAGFLQRYRRDNPGIEVHLVEDGGARLPKRLEQGEVHLAIMPAGGDFPGRLLYPMHLMAVVPRAHPFSAKICIEISALADQPVLVLSREFASRNWFEAACQTARIKPRVLLESAAPQTLIALAKVSYGVAVVPSPVSIQRNGIYTAPFIHHGVSIGRWTIIAWHAQRFLPPYAERFVETIVAQVRRDYPGRELVRDAPRIAKPKTAIR